MARLVGVDLPRDKRMAIALTYVYGIGRSRAAQALVATGISPDLRSGDLTDDQVIALRDWIEASAARLRPISAARLKSAATRGSAIVVAFPYTASERTPTPARERAHARQSPARRRPLNSSPRVCAQPESSGPMTSGE